ncbi:MAG: hypothetical protein AAB460_02090 [Patescibacteria group bacterium]
MSDLLRSVSIDVGNRVRALHLEHVDRGILPSEMTAVCGIIEHLGVNRIIESGRWLGYSTQMLAAYFADAPIRIESIEYYRTDVGALCEERLRPYTNVRLYYGDAMKLLPGLLEGGSEPTALLIDGPKGAKAVGLIKKIFERYENVAVVFLHDSYEGSEARIAIREMGLDAEYTDDTQFVTRFAFLDEGIALGSIHPDKYSGTIKTLPIKSYGPTLAILTSAQTNHGVLRRGVFARLLARCVFAYGIFEAEIRKLVYQIKKKMKSGLL